MSDLLSGITADAYVSETTAVVRRTAERFRNVTQPFSGAARQQLQHRVDAVDLEDGGCGTAAALAEIDDLFVSNAVWFHHPAYQAHLNCPVALPAVATEAILASVNPSVDTYDQSTVGTLIERKLIDWTSSRIGFGEGADGVFTSGGTQSNLHALFLAREWATAQTQSKELDKVKAERAAGSVPPRRSFGFHELLERMVVLATSYSHFSVEKSARLLGLGTDSVVTIPTDSRGRMDPDALAVTIDALRQAGHLPIAVVATAGTTDRGCIDPLTAIGMVCDDTDVWLHVDAAYGGGLLVSPTRRHLLNGIEKARSVTVDYHKTFFQPVSSSAILVRDGRDLEPVSWHADYLNPIDSDEPNQVDKSLQTTRRFDALKLWATLRALGADGVGQMVDQMLDLAAKVHVHLNLDPEFEVVGDTDLSTVLFRYSPEGLSYESADRLVPLVRRLLFDSGRAAIAKTMIDGRPCLKLTLLNPDTTLNDVCSVLNLVRETSAALLDQDSTLIAEVKVAR